MDRRVGNEEGGARDRCRPISRSPRPGGERKSGNQEYGADVLDKVRIKGSGLGHSRHVRVPGWPANSIITPLRTVVTARMAAINRCIGTSDE
jgi:hypothetical protein